MESPIYLRGHARKGPTFRESVLMHAVARLVLDPLITNIQASWVKLNDRRIDNLIERCGTEVIPDKRLALFRELNRIIVDNAYLVPLYSGDMFDGYFQPWIEGIQYPPSGFFQLEIFPISVNPKLTGQRKAAEEERLCGNKH